MMILKKTSKEELDEVNARSKDLDEIIRDAINQLMVGKYVKKCLLRVEELLRKSSIKAAKKDEIINQIKIAQAEKRISSIDEINVDKVAQEVSEQIKLEKNK